MAALAVDAPLWNRVDVPAPPEIWLPYSESEFGAVASITRSIPASLPDTLAEGLHRLGNELHLLRSVAYRVGNQFSNLSAFSAVRQLSTAGRRLRQLPTPEWLQQRAAALLRPGAGRQLQLPSRQLVQHVLNTCQRLGLLLVRLAELAERAARGWLQWLRIGHHASLAVAFVAMSGRVWDLSRTSAARLCRLYGHLLPTLSALKSAGAEWPHPALPPCLRQWLNLPSDVTEETVAAVAAAHRWTPRHHELEFRDQARELTVSLLSKAARASCLQRTFADDRSSPQNGDGESEGLPPSERDMREAVLLGMDEDMGVPVSSASETEADTLGGSEDAGVLPHGPSNGVSAEAAVVTDDRRLYRRLHKLVMQWQAPEHLSEFVREETAARKEDRSKCVTARLKNGQWKLLKEQLKQSRIKWRKRDRKGDAVGAKKAVTRARTCFKLWLLFPLLEGRKPCNWPLILQTLKNKQHQGCFCVFVDCRVMVCLRFFPTSQQKKTWYVDYSYIVLLFYWFA